MLKFIKVFNRDLSGRFENPVFLNADHVVKIEPTTPGTEEACSIVTLTSGEKLEVAGTPEDLMTHDRYFYPKDRQDEEDSKSHRSRKA